MCVRLCLQHPHYIYSPRELSRWMRAMYEAMEPVDAMNVEGLVRLWAHEGLRLFHDRLVTPEEREWRPSQLDVYTRRTLCISNTEIRPKKRNV